MKPVFLKKRQKSGSHSSYLKTNKMNGSFSEFDPSVNLKWAEEELKNLGWKVVKTKCFLIKLKSLLEKS